MKTMKNSVNVRARGDMVGKHTYGGNKQKQDTGEGVEIEGD